MAFIGMIASILGSFARAGYRISSDMKSAQSRALHLGTNIAMGHHRRSAHFVAGVPGIFDGDSVVDVDGLQAFDKPYGLVISVIGGLVVGFAIGKVAEIWTSDHYRPVKTDRGKQSETGPATTDPLRHQRRE